MSYEPYDAAAVRRLLVEQTHDSLTLASHGGAGHLTLGKVRICNPSQFNFAEEGDARHVCATRGTVQHADVSPILIPSPSPVEKSG